MKKAPIPETESARIEALRAYEILDSLPERGYDDVTAIAAEICGTPIALVTFVDTNRQWFKSRVGIRVQETPRDVAFCAHAILDPSAPLVIEDAKQDPRFADNPLVTGEPHVRFYAGMPLVTSDGHALGTLCVIDRKPRSLNAGQLESLAALARQVMAQLELRRTVAELARNGKALARSHRALEARSSDLQRSCDELTALCSILEGQAEIIERDLHRAEIIQRSLLPRSAPVLEDYHILSFYRPGRAIGGDLYDIVRLGPHEIALVVADAAGHGVSAAMLSVLFKHRLRLADEVTGEIYRPADALARVNEALIQDVAVPGAFVTAALCVLDTSTNEVTIASAGHPPVLWLHASGGFDLIQHTGPALGLTSETRYEERSITLNRNDRLLLYSDGLFDINSETDESIAAIANSVQRSPAGETELTDVLIESCGGREREDRDDVTLLLLVAATGESRLTESRDVLGIVKADDEGDAPRISYAEGDTQTFVCLEGRVCWTHGQVILESASSVLESGRDLIIDIAGCTHMDSTVLGTLHELAERADESGATLTIQGASPPLHRSFEELSMAAVTRRLTAVPTAVPTQRTVLELPETDVRRQQFRLLKAHEVLAQLSAENRNEFDDVVRNIRSDIVGERE